MNSIGGKRNQMEIEMKSRTITIFEDFIGIICINRKWNSENLKYTYSRYLLVFMMNRLRGDPSLKESYEINTVANKEDMKNCGIEQRVLLENAT